MALQQRWSLIRVVFLQEVHFTVSPLIHACISFCPCICRTEEEIEKHDKRVAAHWRQLKQTLALEGGPVQVETNNFQHVIDTGKLPLMINAGGSSALPMPRYAGKNKLRGGRKTMGVFESIVAGSEIVKAQQEEMAKKRAECNLANEELLKKIADSKKGRRKYVTGHIQDGLKNQR